MSKDGEVVAKLREAMRSSCPALWALVRRVSSYDTPGRDELEGWVVDNLDRLAVTGGDGLREARGYAVADYAIRVHLPVWLEVSGAGEAAASLRALARIVDGETALAGRNAAVVARGSMAVCEAARRRARDAVEVAVGAGVEGQSVAAADAVVDVVVDAVIASAAKVAGSAALSAADYAFYAAGAGRADAYVGYAGYVGDVVALALQEVDRAVCSVARADWSDTRVAEFDAFRTELRVRLIAALDHKRAQVGAGPVREIGTELLEHVLRVGADTAAEAHQASTKDATAGTDAARKGERAAAGAHGAAIVPPRRRRMSRAKAELLLDFKNDPTLDRHIKGPAKRTADALVRDGLLVWLLGGWAKPTQAGIDELEKLVDAAAAGEPAGDGEGSVRTKEE